MEDANITSTKETKKSLVKIQANAAWCTMNFFPKFRK
jgi:hypothetical protein